MLQGKYEVSDLVKFLADIVPGAREKNAMAVNDEAPQQAQTAPPVKTEL